MATGCTEAVGVGTGTGATAGDGAVAGAVAGVDAVVLGVADFLAGFEAAGSLSTLFVTSGVGVWEAEVAAADLFLAAADLVVAAVAFLGFVSAAGVAKAAAFFSNLAARDWGHFLPVATWHGWHGHSLWS